MGRPCTHWKRFKVNAKAMILRGDLDAARGEILYGLVGPSMTELELVGLRSERSGQELVTEANAENGFFAKKRFERLDRVADRRRIAWTVGQKDPIGCKRQYFG